MTDLFLAEIDSKGQFKGTEHGGEILGLSIVYQLSHAIIHDGVEERQVVPADLATEQVLQHVTVEVQRADLVLQKTEPDDSEINITDIGHFPLTSS